jgi:CBS domain-containing protein
MPEETVADLLRTKPHAEAVCVTADASVTFAVCLMNYHAVGAVLVMDGGRLDGIFTERDVLRRVIEPGLDPRATLVGEVMTADPRTIRADERALRAVAVMIDGNFRHLPVYEGDRVRGTLSMREVTEWLLRRREATPGLRVAG